MIDSLAEYLRSCRTLSSSEVDVRARDRARFDLSPSDRLHHATQRTLCEESRH
jgi:hypothetical protein